MTKMLDKLLPEGDIISAEYKDGTVEVLAKSDENEIDLPMVVLTNNRTASAAELIYTGAARLWKSKIGRSDNLRKGYHADGEETQ